MCVSASQLKNRTHFCISSRCVNKSIFSLVCGQRMGCCVVGLSQREKQAGPSQHVTHSVQLLVTDLLNYSAVEKAWSLQFLQDSLEKAKRDWSSDVYWHTHGSDIGGPAGLLVLVFNVKIISVRSVARVMWEFMQFSHVAVELIAVVSNPITLLISLFLPYSLVTSDTPVLTLNGHQPYDPHSCCKKMRTVWIWDWPCKKVLQSLALLLFTSRFPYSLWRSCESSICATACLHSWLTDWPTDATDMFIRRSMTVKLRPALNGNWPFQHHCL